MRDKPSDGTTDSTRDHHMIGGRLHPVVEKSPNRAQKARASKRNKGEKSGKGVEPASKPHA